MKKFFTIFVFILFSLTLLPTKSFAAQVFFNSEKNNFASNEQFLVKVLVDTKDATVNTVGGTVVFPADLLQLKEIRDGNSSINFWVEKPHSTKTGLIDFSGITVGGFSGHEVFLFSMVFQAKNLGNNMLDFNNIQVLQNDGVGTSVPTETDPFSFNISNQVNNETENLKVIDTEPPENFTPFIARDPSIYDSKYFVVFSTTDKVSGVDHYEIREGLWADYVVADSPYVLQDQSLSNDIFIKAVDKLGNARTVKLTAQNRSYWFEEFTIFGIIIVICFYILRKIWLKFIR